MGFAGKDKLDRALRIVGKPRNPVRLAQQQIPALVTGDAARESNRENIRIEHGTRSFDKVFALAARQASIERVIAHESYQPLLQQYMRAPQVFIRNTFHFISPNTGFSRTFNPVITNALFVKPS